MKKIAFLPILIIFALPLTAQWQWQNPYPTSSALLAVTFVDESNGWSAGEFGVIVHTEDGGNSWKTQASGSTDNLYDICFIDQNEGWAVGGRNIPAPVLYNHYSILHTTDGGSTWESLFNEDGDAVTSVFFIDSDKGWIIKGTYSPVTILNTVDGGETWEEQLVLGYGNDLEDIYFTNQYDGWVVGKNGLILSTHNGGSSWDEQLSDTDIHLKSVFFSDSENGWVSGDSGTILHTNNGGTSWEMQTSETTESLESIYFTNNNNGWAAGSGFIINTINGGNTWAVQSSEIYIESICFVNSDKGWGVGDNTVVNTTNGGNNWSLQSKDVTNNALKDICLLDENNGWAAGENGTILYTSDGGVSWEIQSSGTDEDLEGIWFADLNYGWVVGKNGTILQTDDGGSTWQMQYSGTDADLYKIYGLSAFQIWVVGADGIILKNWEAVTSGTTNTLYDIFFTDPSNGCIAGEYGTILHTDDGGVNWQAQSSGTDYHLKSIYFTDPDNGWAVGENRTVQHTSNGGTVWESQSTAIPEGVHDLSGVFFTNENNGWIAGDGVLIGYQAGKILYTNDGGNSWETNYDQSWSPLFDICFTDPDKGWAVGRSGTILHIDEGTMVSVEEFKIHNSKIGVKVYPNPANQLINIEYSLSNTETVKLSVLDIHGKEISRLLNSTQSAGEYTVHYDATKLPEGIYFIELKTGSEKASTKLVKVK